MFRHFLALLAVIVVTGTERTKTVAGAALAAAVVASCRAKNAARKPISCPQTGRPPTGSRWQP